MVAVFPESPAHLARLGREPRVCAITREPIKPPYMVVPLDKKDGDDFYVNGSAITHENVLDHIKTALGRRGPWKRLPFIDQHVVADLLALASAPHGGLMQQTVMGQQQRAAEMERLARQAAARARGRKKPVPLLVRDVWGMTEADEAHARRLDDLIALIDAAADRKKPNNGRNS